MIKEEKKRKKTRTNESQLNQEGVGVMKTTAAEKEARGRACEFRVASELCRRKMFAALTMGNV